MRRFVVATCVLTALAGASTAARSDTQAVVKLEIRARRPVVDGVYVNGHGPFRFLLDTGATLNHIDPAVARAIGLTETFQTKLMTSAGVTVATGAEARVVQLGAVTAERQVFLLAGLDALREVSRDIQGVLGQAFLSRFDYLLDLESRRIEFGPPAVDGPGTRAAFRVVQGRPVVSTSLGAFVLDSGAHDVIRFGVQAVRISEELVTASGLLKVGTVSSRIDINGRTIWHGDAVVIPRSPEVGADGLLPLHMFRSVYVSNSDRYVILQ